MGIILDKIMINKLIKWIISLIVLLIIHYFWFCDYVFYYSLINDYVFCATICVFVLIGMNYFISNKKEHIANSFFMLSFLQMIAVLIFVLPILQVKENKEVETLNIMILYLIFLFFEVGVIYEFMKKKQNK